MNQSSNHPLNGLSLDERDPQFIESLMPIWQWFYHHYFPVTTEGWHYVPSSGKVLIVGSHNGGLASPDLYMAMYDWFRTFGTHRLAYALAHPNLWNLMPVLAEPAVKCGAIQANAEMAIAALEREAAVLVYPGGLQDVFRPHHHRYDICLAGRTGFIKLALQQEAPIVPIVSKGAHDTLIVVADLYDALHQLHDAGLPWPFDIDPEVFPIYLGLPWGVGIGPLPNIPLPVPIHIRLGAPITFEHYGEDASNDDEYVQFCYEQVRTQMQRELDRLVKA